MKNWAISHLYIGIFLSNMLFFTGGHTDIAVIAGYSQSIISSSEPSFPVVVSFSIGETSASSLTLPNNFPGGIISVATDAHTGNTIFAGAEETNIPLIYSGSVVRSSVNAVPLASGTPEAVFYVATFDHKGNAIVAGQSLEGDGPPIAYRLLSKDKQLTPIILPDVPSGEIKAVAVFPNNTAILVGQNYSRSAPLIYLVPEGSNVATLISLPDPSLLGMIDCVAISPDNAAILAGTDFSNNQALIYRLTSDNYSLTRIPIPGTGDGSFINSLAIAPDGTVILGGGVGEVPLIYSIPPGCDSASFVTNASEGNGVIFSAAIASDGVAILGGSINNTPLVYRVAPGDSYATSIAIPHQVEGAIISIAIGRENIAVLVGASDDNSGLIYTASTTDTVASEITYSIPLPDVLFFAVAVYSCDGLYDIKRLAPYKYNQINQTQNVLQKAGIL